MMPFSVEWCHFNTLGVAPMLVDAEMGPKRFQSAKTATNLVLWCMSWVMSWDFGNVAKMFGKKGNI